MLQVFRSKKSILKLELQNFKKTLNQYQTRIQDLEEFVNFIRRVSEFYDNIMNILHSLSHVKMRKHSLLISELLKFKNNLLIHKDFFGFNRTLDKECAASDSIYLCNVWRLWTKPASYWLQHKEIKNTQIKYMELAGINNYEIILNEAQNYVHEHCQILLDDVNTLLKLMN